MSKQNSPANENNRITSPRQQAQEKSAKPSDRNNPDKRGQTANTKINTTHQGYQQDR
jgi:methylphosphotriester-DNA--protein-cysteine methyltransferase